MDRNRLCLQVEIRSGEKIKQITAFIHGPHISEEHPGCWTCVVEWDGDAQGRKMAFGATPLQAISVSTDVLAASFKLAFGGADIAMDGKPLFF